MSAAVPVPPLFAFLDARFWWATGALCGALLLGAYVIWAARGWSRRGVETPSANEELSRYRALYEKGEISKQEFDRLRGVLGGEIRSSLGLKKKEPGAGPPPQAEEPREPPSS
jgi:hypothetical protein